MTRVISACHHEDVTDPGVDELLQRKVDHRPIIDRQKVLIGDSRHRKETRAEAAGENHPLHFSQSSVAARATDCPAAT